MWLSLLPHLGLLGSPSTAELDFQSHVCMIRSVTLRFGWQFKGHLSLIDMARWIWLFGIREAHSCPLVPCSFRRWRALCIRSAMGQRLLFQIHATPIQVEYSEGARHAEMHSPPKHNTYSKPIWKAPCLRYARFTLLAVVEGTLNKHMLGAC